MDEREREAPVPEETLSEERERKAVYRFLSYRERSRGEVRHFLEQKGVRNAEALLHRLETEGLLNDARFAQNRLEYRLRNGYGPLSIRQEFRAVHLEESLIDRLLAETEEKSFLEAALLHLERKSAQWSSRSHPTAAALRALQSRGFTSSQIRRALEEMGQRHPELFAGEEREELYE